LPVYIAAVDNDRFWEIIRQADSPQDLHQRLAQLPESDLADFEVHHQRAFADSYDWGLWGAAYVINGGCSEESWEDWMSPSMYVVEARTCDYAYVAPERHPQRTEEPTGQDWDEDDLDERFPRLTEKYSG
jgi:Protein of unknown function (DUF4240)